MATQKELAAQWIAFGSQAARQWHQGSMCLASFGGQFLHSFSEMHNDLASDYLRDRDTRVMPVQIEAYSCACVMPEHLFGQPDVRVKNHSQCRERPKAKPR
jgi:hypothetical protein